MGKLEHEMNLDAVLELGAASAGEFAERAIDTKVLLEELGNGPFFHRKDLCEFLGIGESTLTGWLKADRIPRAAKVAYVLLVGMEVLQSEIYRLGSEARDLKVVKDGDKYLVVRFPTLDTDLRAGEIASKEIRARVLAGEIVARDIADAKTASMLAASSRTLKLLDDIFSSQESIWEEDSEDGNPWFQEILTRVRKELSLMPDPGLGDLPSAIRKPSAAGSAPESEPAPNDQPGSPSTGTGPSPDAESQGEDR